MSVKVDLAEVAATATSRPIAYLVTAGGGDSPRSHLLAVVPAFDDAGTVVVGGVGRHTVANVAAGSMATLVWPPTEPDGYTLIVDGGAAIDGESTVVVTPTKAILHRPAVDLDGSRAGSDCRDVGAPAAGA